MASSKTVLLVEDDPSDVMLMEDALKGQERTIDLKVVTSGDAALDYLRGEGLYAGAARPSLVLLDWRLPGRSGEEVLREIRATSDLKLLPVLVLTTSSSERDVAAAYSLGANTFFTKPTGLNQLRVLVSLIVEYWLVNAVRPTEGRLRQGKDTHA